jgi:hypothetical protein
VVLAAEALANNALRRIWSGLIQDQIFETPAFSAEARRKAEKSKSRSRVFKFYAAKLRLIALFPKALKYSAKVHFVWIP